MVSVPAFLLYKPSPPSTTTPWLCPFLIADALADGFDVAGFIATGPRITVQPLGDELDLPEYDGQADHDSDATVWGTEDALAVSLITVINWQEEK